MATTKNVVKPDSVATVEQLHDEAVTVLTELIDALTERAHENPGEHNVEPMQNARRALIALSPTAL